METKPVSDRMYSLIVLYDMHTDFFKRAIDGIKDEDAHNRMNTKANHIAWLVGSFVHERFELAKIFNPGSSDQKQVADELFKHNKGIQENVT